MAGCQAGLSERNGRVGLWPPQAPACSVRHMVIWLACGAVAWCVGGLGLALLIGRLLAYAER